MYKNLKALAVLGAGKSVTKTKYIGEEEKWTNKGYDKHDTHYNMSYPMFLRNFKIPGEIALRDIFDEIFYWRKRKTDK